MSLIVFFILTLYVVGSMFVDSIVGQVHAQVRYVLIFWQSIFFSGKANQSIIKKENSHRLSPGNQDIYPQIKLQTIQQIWLVKIALYHKPFSNWKIFRTSYQKYSTTLAISFRFNYKCFRLSVFKLSLEFIFVIGQVESDGEKVVLVRKQLFHSIQMFTKVIFARNVVHSWKMIYFLVLFHFGKLFRNYSSITPHYIPVFAFFTSGQSPVISIFKNFLNHFILSTCDVGLNFSTIFICP